MAWALVVFAQAEMRLLIEGIVGECVGTDNHVALARTLDEARQVLLHQGLRDCRLLVAALRVPCSANESPALDGNARNTLQLVRELRAQGASDLPIIITTALADADADAEMDDEDLGDIHLVPIDSKFYRTFPAMVKEVLLPEADALRGIRRRGPLDLEIQLHPPFHVKIRSESVDDAGVLEIDRKTLDSLKGLGERLPEFCQLRVYGEMVYRAVMNTSINRHGDHLLSWIKRVGGVGETRIRFDVDRESHPMLLEALAQPSLDEGSDPSFWMLQAPIFRKYNRPGERHVLFRDRETLNEPINCLIVQGRSDDFYAGAPIDRGFDPLPLLADEVENLETFLNASRHVGKVEVLRCGEHRGGFADALKNKLAERHWQLVHYAGHSAKGGAASRGFLVAGGDVTECIDANEFAAWSAHAQFVFLNSCRSADTYFVVQIVEKLIPAVLGYRWPIGDRPAMEFAQSFYRHLFDDSEVNRHIEYAYLQAKRDLHRWESLACSWAAPMLVMQLLQSAERA